MEIECSIVGYIYDQIVAIQSIPQPHFELALTLRKFYIRRIIVCIYNYKHKRTHAFQIIAKFSDTWQNILTIGEKYFHVAKKETKIAITLSFGKIPIQIQF